jgi:hypothetical protein
MWAEKMTQPKTRKSSKTKTTTGPHLKIPAQETIKEIVADLRLSEDQAVVLEFVVKNTLADVLLYQLVRSREGDRDELIRDLIELEKRLGRVISFLEGRTNLLQEILPTAVLDEFGELFSFTSIGRALGKDVFPENPHLLMKYLKDRKLPFGLAPAEAFFARKRADLGLLHGDALFLHVLRLIHAPLKTWLAAKAADKGGRPRSAERRFIIERLAKAAPEILGSEPTASVTGLFVQLCERVLTACGFAEDGIDKAVISVLSSRESAADAVQAPGSAKS